MPWPRLHGRTCQKQRGRGVEGLQLQGWELRAPQIDVQCQDNLPWLYTRVRLEILSLYIQRTPSVLYPPPGQWPMKRGSTRFQAVRGTARVWGAPLMSPRPLGKMSWVSSPEHSQDWQPVALDLPSVCSSLTFIQHDH